MQADASNALRAQLEQLTGDYNFALQRKYAFPAAVQVVEDVTKLLPDDTWLTQFEVKTQGRGKDAAPRAPAARRERKCRAPGFAARGIETLRAGGAALADDEDSAGPGRDLRPGRTAETASAATARAGCRRPGYGWPAAGGNGVVLPTPAATPSAAARRERPRPRPRPRPRRRPIRAHRDAPPAGKTWHATRRRAAPRPPEFQPVFRKVRIRSPAATAGPARSAGSPTRRTRPRAPRPRRASRAVRPRAPRPAA